MKVKILEGNCIEQLKSLPDESVNCCITSPPYWGLRDYGTGSMQIGLEHTPDSYVQNIVNVFRGVKRVLRNDGTLWLNLGDSYASYRDGKATPDTARNGNNGTLVDSGLAKNRMASTFAGTGVKHKDLVGIPWRVAFALQADGWYLRQDIIWHKPNPMPESVTDRCTKAHEYIFLMSKSANYHYDSDAIKEMANPDNAKRYKYQFGGPKNEVLADTKFGATKPIGHREYDCKRNKRSVWSVNVKPYKEAHFATYPAELIEPCVLAGCPVGGTVLDPFGGSGTTAQVAVEHGRNAILCELNPEYIKLINKRIAEAQPLLLM
jgi:DNA modification methylase